MKLKNAPERKNQRRKDAAARMAKLPNMKFSTEQDMANTLAKVSPASLRDVRTKKDRSSRGRLSTNR